MSTYIVLTAPRYASAVYAVVACLSVRLFVRPSVCHRPALYQAKSRITQTTPYDSPGAKNDAKNLGEIPTGFVDAVKFSHNGASGPESKTTRMFHLDI